MTDMKRMMIKRTPGNQPKLSGFTLIELAIVLLIISIFAGSAVSVGYTLMEADRVATTKERMQTIIDALNLYVEENGHLPCPADNRLGTTDTNYGVGIGTNDRGGDGNPNEGNCSAIEVGGVGMTSIFYGMVPFKDLGLNGVVALDGWDNRFTFIVDEDLTFRGDVWTDNGSRKYGFANNGNPDLYDDQSLTPPVTANDVSTQGRIRITNHSGADASTVTENAAYVLISHGKNGLGAVTNDGIRIPGFGDNSERSNADHGMGPGRVQKLPTSTFDDIVYYQTKWQMPRVGAPPNCPEGIPGCRMWMDAGHNVTVDGSGNVTQWVGRSDYAVEFWPVSPSPSPALISPVPKPQLTGDGIHFQAGELLLQTSDGLYSLSDIFVGITAMTYCSVIFNEGIGSSGALRALHTSPAQFNEQINATDEAWEFTIGAGVTQTSSAGSTTALYSPSTLRDAEIVCHVIDTDADTASTYVNGVQTLNNTSFTETFPGSPAAFALGASDAASDFAPIIAEIVYYDRALDTTELNTIITYLTDKHLP